MDDQVTMDSRQKVQQGSWGPVGGSIWNTWPSPSWERDMNISINDEEFVTGLNLEKTVGVLTAMDLEKEIFIKMEKA